LDFWYEIGSALAQWILKPFTLNKN